MSAWPAFNSIHWLASIVLLVLLVYTLRQDNRKISVPLALFIGLTATWCLTAALIGVVPDLETKILINRIKMVAVASVSLSVCYLASAINSELRIRGWIWLLAFIIPISSVVITLSPYHELLITNYVVKELHDGTLFAYSNGPWFHVHSLVARLLIMCGLFILWQGMKSLHPFHRTRNKLIIMSIALPSIIDTFAVYFYPELRYIQIVPTALAFTSIVLVYTVFGHKALEVIPFARAEIVEQMPDPCLMWDQRGRLIDYNPAAHKYFQLKTTAIGRYIEETLDLPLEIRSSYPWSTPFEVEHSGTCFSAESRHVHDKQGQIIGAILMLKDVSGQKKVERELRGLNQVKTTFMGILAHDLVGNVSSIANTSEILIKEHSKMSPHDVQANLESIHTGARDVNEFIMQLADWARTQFRTLQVEKTSLDMRVTTQKVVDYLRPLAIEKELNIQLRIPEKTHVPADSRMIETVLRNLLANSIKFSPTGSDIVIVASDAGSAHKFSFIDQGTSMDFARLNSFFQDTTAEISTANFGTQGLGLLLCRSFIRMHQGHIWAEKMQDGTSAIHFHLDKERAV